ncbi:MAG: GIY-YIG nuclease family protein [Hyphomicrobiaceae bacterium]|nr:MAG: GIY-YIG nuclease family protein [Hyphomicrobiaceae bacterium]
MDGGMSSPAPVLTMWGRADGCIYFIVNNPDNPHFVKIGFTSGDPMKRLKALQTGSPFRLFLFGSCPATRDGEREVHDLLQRYRLHGEWFSWSKFVAETCNSLLDHKT